MGKYPEIYFPNIYKNYLDLQNSKIQDFGPSPTKIVKNSFRLELRIFLLILIGIVEFISDIKSNEDRWALGILLFVVIHFVIRFFEEYSEEKRAEEEYKRKKRDFEREYTLISRSNDLVRERISQFQFDFSEDDFKKIDGEGKKRIYLLLFENHFSFSYNRNSSKGVTEDLFLVFLLNAFPNKILTNVSISHYDPDFLYYDSEKNIAIDIEIDEPYSFKDKEMKPIHFNDDLRNEFFLSINVIIIRFSELQICKCPIECIDVIQKVVSMAEKGFFPHSKCLTHKMSENTSKWSMEEAKQMQAENFRNSYLPDNLKYKPITIEGLVSRPPIDDLPF